MPESEQLAVLQTLRSAADHYEAAQGLAASGDVENAIRRFDICLKVHFCVSPFVCVSVPDLCLPWRLMSLWYHGVV
jgi:hypothetical protein